MKNSNIIIWLISLVFIVSCNKTEWDKEVPLSLKAHSDMDHPIEVDNYTINVEEIKLTITGIRIHGERLQADDIERVYTDEVYVSFSEPESFNYEIDLPIGTYEKLEISIDFDTEVGSPHFFGEISGNGNQPFQSTIDIPLNFTQIESLPIKTQNNNNVILIDENTKFVEFIFNGQEGFDGINTGSWHALMNANLGQSEIDLNTVIGTQFSENINNSFLSTIQLKISN